MTDHETWACRRCGEHHAVPRDPAAYEASIHFGQQYKFRDTPDNVVSDCIEDGEVRDHRNPQKRIFESRYRQLDERWHIIVKFRPRAYHDDGEHEAVTVYEASNPPDRNF
jgi:hypothetical protein